MNIQRKLARFEQIDDVVVHPNADKLEIAKVGGWHVVVQKGLYNPGDTAVFFEVDAFLPIEERYSFLEKSSLRNHPELGIGYRIKTVKLRGEVSQGLLMPLNEMSDLLQIALQVGVENDLTEFLRVRKWEAPVSGVALGGDAIGGFPSFIPKTDQNRYQNLRECEKSYFENDVFEMTVKMDGTSVTIFKKDGEVGVCSRNLQLKETDSSLIWNVAKSQGIIDIVKDDLRDNTALQGELVGPGIQKNHADLSERRILVFDLYDIKNNCYMNGNWRRFILNNLGIDAVPYVGECNLSMVKEMVEKHSQFHFLWNKEPSMIEGLVFKSIQNPHFSFKYINPQYLLKYDE